MWSQLWYLKSSRVGTPTRTCYGFLDFFCPKTSNQWCIAYKNLGFFRRRLRKLRLRAWVKNLDCLWIAQYSGKDTVTISACANPFSSPGFLAGDFLASSIQCYKTYVCFLIPSMYTVRISSSSSSHLRKQILPRPSKLRETLKILNSSFQLLQVSYPANHFPNLVKMKKH